MTNICVKPDQDEQLDTIPGTDFSLIQKADGTAFTIDTLLLANFVEFEPNNVNIADLGSGSGILSFLLKYRKKNSNVIGFEIQKEFYDLAIRNSLLNYQFKDIFFKNIDIRIISEIVKPNSFDIVVSNPPYFKIGNGKLPLKQSRAFSRHELNGTLHDFVRAASYILTDKGKFCVVIPSSRFNEISKLFRKTNFGLKRVQYLLPKENELSHLVLIEAQKNYNGLCEYLNQFAIHKSNGQYSDEVTYIFDKNLKQEN